MAVLSLVWGILAIIGFGLGFLPCLGALNWVNIPFAVVGLIISIIATTNAPADQRGMTVTGIVLCAIAVVIGAFRLVLGGGLL